MGCIAREWLLRQCKLLGLSKPLSVSSYAAYEIRSIADARALGQHLMLLFPDGATPSAISLSGEWLYLRATIKAKAKAKTKPFSGVCTSSLLWQPRGVHTPYYISINGITALLNTWDVPDDER